MQKRCTYRGGSVEIEANYETVYNMTVTNYDRLYKMTQSSLHYTLQ